MDFSGVSTELAGVKAEFNLNAGAKNSVDGLTVFERLKRSIAPTRFAAKQIEVGKSKALGIVEVRKILIDGGIPELVAEPLAYECVNGMRHLDNLEQIFHLAEHVSSDVSQLKDPSQAFVNAFVPYAQDVSDFEMQEMWARLLVGEMEKTDGFSKKAMSALSRMHPEDARSFSALCANSVYATGMESADVLPVLEYSEEHGGSFNDGAVLVQSISTFESLGLVSATLKRTLRVEPGTGISLLLKNGTATLKNESDTVRSIEFNRIVLLEPGCELARLCEVGTALGLEERLNRYAEEAGLSFSYELKTESA